MSTIANFTALTALLENDITVTVTGVGGFVCDDAVAVEGGGGGIGGGLYTGRTIVLYTNRVAVCYRLVCA